MMHIFHSELLNKGIFFYIFGRFTDPCQKDFSYLPTNFFLQKFSLLEVPGGQGSLKKRRLLSTPLGEWQILVLEKNREIVIP